MGYPAATRILFAAGDDAEDGGGTIRDQLLHTSFQIDFEAEHPYSKLTIPLDNELDKPVDVKLYGRTEIPGDTWHQLGPDVAMEATSQDEITLTDQWRSLKITVQESSAVDPTSGDFLAKLMPVLED